MTRARIERRRSHASDCGGPGLNSPEADRRGCRWPVGQDRGERPLQRTSGSPVKATSHGLSSGLALDEALASECFRPVLGADGVLGAREERDAGVPSLGVEDVERHIEIRIAVAVEQPFFDGAGFDPLARFDGRVLRMHALPKQLDDQERAETIKIRLAAPVEPAAPMLPSTYRPAPGWVNRRHGPES